jgi:hypothetical protein
MHRWGALQGKWSANDITRKCVRCGVEVRMQRGPRGGLTLQYFDAKGVGLGTEPPKCGEKVGKRERH